MKNQAFTTIPTPRVKRNAFDLSHEKKLSFQIGQLIPIYMQDILPSDKFRVSTELLVRLAPLLAPLMHRIDVFVHYFFVPYRIIWDSFQDFITGGRQGLDTTVLPYRTYNNANKAYFDKGTLMDYLGIPPTAAVITQDIDISVLPIRAYLSIYNDYYRNKDIEAEHDIDADSDGDVTAWANGYPFCYNRHLERDYFTSALTTAQRGNAVELDLDIFGNGDPINVEVSGADPAVGNVTFDGTSNYFRDSASGIVDFSSAFKQGITATLEITELRRAARLLEWLEKQNIGSGRYKETIEMHFGQKSSDARLDYVEYLGGGKSQVQISEVQNSSQTFDPTAGVNDGAGGVPVSIDPQANLAGKGISIGKTNQFTKQFEEHGLVMGIMSVMPRTAYMEGIAKYWRKTDKTEFFWPAFAQLGEQEVLQSEIYWDPVGTDMDDTFGYQSRYAEYKFALDSVHGDFIDDFDYWHMLRVLGSAPTLNATFTKCESSNYDRVFAVTTGSVHKLYAQIYNDVKAIRPIPTYNIPAL